MLHPSRTLCHTVLHSVSLSRKHAQQGNLGLPSLLLSLCYPFFFISYEWSQKHKHRIQRLLVLFLYLIKITWNEFWTCLKDILQVSLLHLVQLMLMASLLIIGKTIINSSLWISDHPRLICFDQSSWLWRIRGTVVLAVSPGTTDSSLRIVTEDKAWLGRFGMRKKWVDPFKVS